MINKKIWLFIITILSVSTLATEFNWVLTQEVTGQIGGGRCHYSPYHELVDWGHNNNLPWASAYHQQSSFSESNSRQLLKLPYPYEISVKGMNVHWGLHDLEEGYQGGVSIFSNNRYETSAIATGYTRNTYENTIWITATGDEIRGCSYDYRGGRQPVQQGRFWARMNSSPYANTIIFGEQNKNIGPIARFARPYLLTDEEPVFYATPNTTNILLEVTSQNIIACTDYDESGKCDYEQAEACDNTGGDWAWYYDSNLNKTVNTCCGISIAPDTCTYYSQDNLICGQNEQQQWQTLSNLQKGITKKLQCPTNISVLSTGQQILTCEKPNERATTIPKNNFTRTTLYDREFICVPEQANIYECIGNNTFPLVTSNPFREQGERIIVGPTTYECQQNSTWIVYRTPCLAGERRTNDETGLIEFCSPTQGWIIDLDTDEGACRAAGRLYNTIRWTGTQCCGDPLDNNTPQAIYEEQNGLGACLNNTPIMSGQTITNNTVINHQGQFYQCQGTLPSPELQNAGITPAHQGVCGQPLLNTTSSTHSICLPNGKWHQTPHTEIHQTKTVAWQTLPNQLQQGCCPENKCWDGNTCKNPGEYYQIENQGYQCQT
ncbi:hypothetical protein COV18_03585 [Candidatus Woesearchaeota archaeon CG10_big_fil_rev_8_21_14_0_10_37_12]|nr:MAG: hypothetical protein COV18_03585 [Candidatus Woesearchaeota archaeon CG10_big_fil_rev_8_21_14_0_10_37_12]